MSAGPLGVLLALTVSLGGCSLSMPEDTELFSDRDTMDGSAGGQDAGAMDGSADGSSGGDGGSMPGDDAATDDGGDAEGGSDAGADGGAGDGGPTVFDPAAGLVLHYRFNETSGNVVNDFSGNSKDGLVVGTPASYSQWVASGRVGGALRLAGGPAPMADAGTGHYVELPQGVLLGLEECSIAVWVNRAVGGPMWARVFDLGNQEITWLYFAPIGGPGLPVVAGRTPGLIFVDFQPIDMAPTGQGVLRINKPIPEATWVHIVVTWSGEQIKFYMDGKLVAETVTHGSITPTDLGNTGQNYLGRSQYPTDPYFGGMMDEFRIYDHVLSASDVEQLYAVQ